MDVLLALFNKILVDGDVTITTAVLIILINSGLLIYVIQKFLKPNFKKFSNQQTKLETVERLVKSNLTEIPGKINPILTSVKLENERRHTHIINLIEKIQSELDWHTDEYGKEFKSVHTKLNEIDKTLSSINALLITVNSNIQFSTMLSNKSIK